MKTKVYMVRIDEHLIIGFAKYKDHGLGAALLHAKGMSRREAEHDMKNRFYSQRHNMASSEGVDITEFDGFVFEWLDFNEITNPRPKQMAFDNGEPRDWYIDDTDGRYEPKKIDKELMTSAECQSLVLKHWGL